MSFLGLYLGRMSVSKPCPYLSILQSYWNLHVWNRQEALFLSSVSRYLGLSIVFTSDLEYFAPLSSVGRIGTLMCLCCRGEPDYHRICCVCRGLLLVRVAVCLSRVTIRAETMSYVGSWTAPKTTTFGCFDHSSCVGVVKDLSVVFRRIVLNCPDAHPVPERFPEGQQRC